ncbi:hypothetical protein P4C99_21620 [Pontiellaceae bacterium B1224]|nr:hypothetical protein [Pontiellaceae bacterium B1224]
MLNKIKSKIDGLLFILFGVYIALVWFYCTYFVVAHMRVKGDEKYMVPEVPSVANGLEEMIKIPWEIQSILFFIPMLFFIGWGIFTIKRK